MLTRRRHKVAHLEPERRHRLAHALGRRDAGGRPERKPHDRAGPQPECECAEGGGRKRGSQHDGAQRGEWNEPGRCHPGPADELRPDDDEHGRRRGEPELGIAPAREQVTLDRHPVELDDSTQNQTSREKDRRCGEEIARQVPTPSQQHVEDDQEREHEQPDERDPPERVSPTEDGPERLRDFLVLLGCRPRDRRRQPDRDRRHAQQHSVDRAPVPSARLGRRQQRELPRTLGRRCLRLGARIGGRHDCGSSVSAASQVRTCARRPSP